VDKKLTELRNQNLEKVKLEGNKENLEGKICGDESTIKSTRINIKGKEEEIKNIGKNLDKLSKIKNPTTKTSAQIKEEIKKFQEINDKLVGSNTSSKDLSSSITKLEKKVSGKNKKEIQKETISKEKALKLTMKKFTKIEKKRDSSIKQKTEYEININNLQAEIGKFVKLGTKCPVCEQKITIEHLKDLEGERKTKLYELSIKLKKIVTTLSNTKKQHTKLSNESEKLKTEISENELMIPQIEEFEEKSREFDKIETKIKGLNAQNKIPKEKFEYESDDPVEYLSALKDALVEYDNSVATIAATKENQEKTRKSILKDKADLKLLETKITNNDKKITGIEKQLLLFANIVDEVKDTEKEFKNNNEEITQASISIASSKQEMKNENEKILIKKIKITESQKL
jgi:DNA repair exonuclease SbcCD ATPase subunit